MKLFNRDLFIKRSSHRNFLEVCDGMMKKRYTLGMSLRKKAGKVGEIKKINEAALRATFQTHKLSPGETGAVEKNKGKKKGKTR